MNQIASRALTSVFGALKVGNATSQTSRVQAGPRSQAKNPPLHRLVVNCDGGLGNQMFEYAAGVYFSGVFDRTLEVLRPMPSNQQWQGYQRPFQLDKFCITAEIRDPNLVDRLFVSRSAVAGRVREKLSAALTRQMLAEPSAYSYHGDLQEHPARRHTYMTGYWQAAAYVEAVDAELRRQFKLRAPLLPRNREYAQQIAALRCPVSVHLRVGDYSLIKHRVGETQEYVSQVLPWRYYERAIAALEDAVGEDYTLVVFSDEQQKAKDLFRRLDRCLFIEGNDAASAPEEMILMSLCGHHVIANSSFSWWGAWLNASSEKRVFAPRYWGNTTDSHFPALYPRGWTTIDNL